MEANENQSESQFCGSCGAKNPKYTAFCSACGKPLTAQPVLENQASEINENQVLTEVTPTRKRPWIFYSLLAVGIILIFVFGKDTFLQNLGALAIILPASMLFAFLSGFLFSGTFWGRTKNIYVGFLYFMVLLSMLPDSSTGSSSGHTCTYCSNHYSNNGYYHLENECVAYQTDPGFDDHCSNKCCSEDWDKNGSGRFHRR